MTQNISLSTTAYIVSHGRAPRGRGAWAFEFKFATATGTGWSEPVFFPVATYSVARGAALRHAAAVGALNVRVAT